MRLPGAGHVEPGRVGGDDNQIGGADGGGDDVSVARRGVNDDDLVGAGSEVLQGGLVGRLYGESQGVGIAERSFCPCGG